MSCKIKLPISIQRNCRYFPMPLSRFSSIIEIYVPYNFPLREMWAPRKVRKLFLRILDLQQTEKLCSTEEIPRKESQLWIMGNSSIKTHSPIVCKRLNKMSSRMWISWRPCSVDPLLWVSQDCLVGRTDVLSLLNGMYVFPVVCIIEWVPGILHDSRRHEPYWALLQVIFLEW